MFAVVDTDGQLEWHSEAVTLESVNGVLPSGCFSLVRLRAQPHMYGAVDDTGIVAGLPRNPVGSVLIAILGGPSYAYAGPVVVTGWQEPDEVSEFRSLSIGQVAKLTWLHGLITGAIANREVDLAPEDAEEIRVHANWVTTGVL